MHDDDDISPAAVELGDYVAKGAVALVAAGMLALLIFILLSLIY